MPRVRRLPPTRLAAPLESVRAAARQRAGRGRARRAHRARAASAIRRSGRSQSISCCKRRERTPPSSRWWGTAGSTSRSSGGRSGHWSRFRNDGPVATRSATLRAELEGAPPAAATEARDGAPDRHVHRGTVHTPRECRGCRRGGVLRSRARGPARRADLARVRRFGYGVEQRAGGDAPRRAPRVRRNRDGRSVGPAAIDPPRRLRLGHRVRHLGVLAERVLHDRRADLPTLVPLHHGNRGHRRSRRGSARGRPRVRDIDARARRGVRVLALGGHPAVRRHRARGVAHPVRARSAHDPAHARDRPAAGRDEALRSAGPNRRGPGPGPRHPRPRLRTPVPAARRRRLPAQYLQRSFVAAREQVPHRCPRLLEQRDRPLSNGDDRSSGTVRPVARGPPRGGTWAASDRGVRIDHRDGNADGVLPLGRRVDLGHGRGVDHRCERRRDRARARWGSSYSRRRRAARRTACSA